MFLLLIFSLFSDNSNYLFIIHNANSILHIFFTVFRIVSVYFNYPHLVITVKNIVWFDILSKIDFNNIRDKILKSQPIHNDKNRLNDSSILIDSLKEYSICMSSMSILSAAIIIPNLAVIKRSGLNSELILIIRKISNTWKVICAKNSILN